jgi:hypothetical protein
VPEDWETAIGEEMEQHSRAPFFVLHPDALVAVRDELRRIRAGRGTDLELEDDDDVWPVVDNARRLDEMLAEMGVSTRLVGSSSSCSRLSARRGVAEVHAACFAQSNRSNA